jgi:hypothetical protein
LEDGVSSEANGAAHAFVGMNIVVMHVKSALGIEVSVARRAAKWVSVLYIVIGLPLGPEYRIAG